MTTAREQAREAAWAVQEPLALDDGDITGAADAASDVWEPLLCDAIEIIVSLADQQAMPDDFYVTMLARLRSAVGESNNLGQVNYDGTDPSVECSYPPCRNRLRRSAWNVDENGSQWCSQEHRSLSEG